MYFALTSESTDPAVSSEILRRIAASLEVQLYRDYAPFWQAAGAAVRAYASPQDVPDDNQVCPIIVFDDADQAGALGYHSVGPDGRAFGKIFWRVIKANGGTLVDGAESLSVTLSHEVLETFGDPYVSWWADIDSETEEAFELCDRCQADSYDIEGIAVSNFLGPRAFRAGTGPYDFMRLLKSPWEIRPGGYAIRRKAGQIVYAWDAKVPEWKRALKERPAVGRKVGKR